MQLNPARQVIVPFTPDKICISRMTNMKFTVIHYAMFTLYVTSMWKAWENYVDIAYEFITMWQLSHPRRHRKKLHSDKNYVDKITCMKFIVMIFTTFKKETLHMYTYTRRKKFCWCCDFFIWFLYRNLYGARNQERVCENILWVSGISDWPT